MGVEIVDRARLKRILLAFSWFDDARWSEAANYNLVNGVCELTADEWLLTHWLCYIADRGMPFRRVWAVGGYVVSHLVRAYRNGSRSVGELAADYVQLAENGDSGSDQVSLRCPVEAPNKLLADFGFAGKSVRFASRYMPQDAFLIFRTLEMLDLCSNRSFVGFLRPALASPGEPRSVILRLAAGLDALTYRNGKAVNGRQLRPRLDKLRTDLGPIGDSYRRDPNKWMEDQQKQFRRWGKKRLWCSLRDYLKSPAFNDYFVKALREAGAPYPEAWQRDNGRLREALDALELPGDVWNNNRKLRDGLFPRSVVSIPKTWDMPRAVRGMYESMGDELRGRFCPEQLDVTFDFVPRMCEREMCSVCPFGGGVGRICHRQHGLLCPLSLVACGYCSTCSPSTCELKNDALRGTCARSCGSAAG